MPFKKVIALLPFIIIGFSAAMAQTTIRGTVRDSANNQLLAYVNIGIAHKNIGCVSQKDGSFSLTIPAEDKLDTITFSMVGYHDHKLPINSIAGEASVKLAPKITQMNEVSITFPALTEKKFGESNYHALIQFTDGSTNQMDIFEIAQLIKLDTGLIKLTSVNLYISASRPDSGTFRINFYGYDGKHPTARIIDKNIIQTHAIQKGWLTFDLKPYNIYLKGDVVAGIEFLPNSPVNKPINYNIKVVGATKSFYRNSSQGDWRLPPHHYVLYVTALSNKAKD